MPLLVQTRLLDQIPTSLYYESFFAKGQGLHDKEICKCWELLVEFVFTLS
jgi:hypothetical protein